MQKKILSNIFILVSIFLVSCSGSKSIEASSKSVKNIGKERSSSLLFTPEKIKRSISKYEEILKSNPSDPNALAGLSESYAILGYYNQEIKSYYETEFNLANKYILYALNKDRDNYNVKRALAYNYLFLSRERDAKIISKEILDKNPKDSDAIYIYWAASGKNPEDSEIQKVLDDKPSFILARVDYAKSLFYKRSYTRAAEEISKAIVVYDSPYLRTTLGTILRTKRAISDSLVEYKNALNIDSNFAPAYMNRGISLYYRGETKKSIENLQKAISLNPNYADSYFYLAGNYQKSGNRNLALTNYRKFLSMAAGQPQYTFLAKKANENILKISN